MLYSVFKILISVRSKLFFGFCAMTMIIALLGGYAYISVSNAGKVVKETFDRPLMAINYARSASQIFGEIEMKVLQAELLNKTQDPEAYQSILRRVDDFKADVEIAKARSIAPKSEKIFVEVETLTESWMDIILTSEGVISAKSPSATALADQIEESLEIITELQTNQSFRNREIALAQMDRVKTYSLIAGVIGLLLTAIISSWVAITIINPLKAAAGAARKISAGNLEAIIPTGGDDETGALLKTMSQMQKNIRDRMSLEQNLRSVAQTRLSESLENSKDAILLADQDGRIIVANQQVNTLFPALNSIDLHGRVYTNFFEKHGISKNDKCQYFHADREIKFEDDRWARVNASNTKEGGRLIIWTDITQAKERNERLLFAKEQAEAADKSKSLFLAAMSHELRTPLNAVIGFSDIIHSQSLGQVGNDRYVEMARLISHSGEHLLKIVQDVLSIANGEQATEITNTITNVNITDVIRQSLKSVANDANKRSINVVFRDDTPDAFVSGEAQKLRQVILNVLSNALKFNNDGGVVKIGLDIGRNGAVRIDIIDNGIGIAEEDISRIQEPFVQVDNGFTRQYEGAGLGLSIVRQLVEAHNGKLMIQSKLEKGTCVSLLFPAVARVKALPVKKAA